MPPKEPVVYFLAAAGFIKIGYATNLVSRFRDLDSACPVELSVIGWVPGGRQLELAFHRLLSKHRKKGEWFADCAEVRAIIKRALSGAAAEILSDGLNLKADEDRASVASASDALRKLAGPGERGDSTADAIHRAARAAGLPYWRTFDLWYNKARRITAQERDAITAAMESST